MLEKGPGDPPGKTVQIAHHHIFKTDSTNPMPPPDVPDPKRSTPAEGEACRPPAPVERGKHIRHCSQVIHRPDLPGICPCFSISNPPTTGSRISGSPQPRRRPWRQAFTTPKSPPPHPYAQLTFESARYRNPASPRSTAGQRQATGNSRSRRPRSCSRTNGPTGTRNKAAPTPTSTDQASGTPPHP